MSVAIDVMLHRGRAVMLPSVFRGLPRTFWVLWIAIIIDRLGGFAFAFLTLYLTGERHLGVDEATAIVSLAGLGGLAGALAGGILSDHLGRKVTLCLGATSAAITLGGLAFVREPLPIAALWLVNGFSSVLSRLGGPSLWLGCLVVGALSSAGKALMARHWRGR